MQRGADAHPTGGALVALLACAWLAASPSSALRFSLDVPDQVEALVDVALAHGWARIGFAPSAGGSNEQLWSDTEAEQALNLTLRNHNLPPWEPADAQLVIASPLTSAAVQALATSVAGTPARLGLLSASCASGTGADDAAAAAASQGPASALLGQPALRLPPVGSLCVRPLPPQMELDRGTNVTRIGEAWLDSTDASSISYSADVAWRWEGLSLGPLASKCGANCTTGALREGFVWEYTAGPETAQAGGTGVRRFLAPGVSNRTSCGAPTGLLPAAQRSLVLGQSTPLTGAAAGLGVSMQQGMLRAIRHHPSSHGRRLVLLSLDDAYVPAKTAANVRRLVEEVGIFALVGSVGSATGAAVVDYLNDMGVPHIGQLSGANVFRYPPRRFTINVRAAYADEAAAMVDEVTQFGLSKVALVAQNDTYGKAGLVGLETALGPRGLKLHSIGYYSSSDIPGTIEGAISAINSTGEDPEAVVFFALADAAALAMPLLRKQMPGAMFMLASPISPPSLLKALAANPAVGSTSAAASIVDGSFVTQAVWPPDLSVGDSTRADVNWVDKEGEYALALVALALDTIPAPDGGGWVGLDLINAINDRSVFRVDTSTATGSAVRVLGPYSAACSQGMRSVVKTRLTKVPASSEPAGPGEGSLLTTITGVFEFDSCGVLDTSAVELAEPLVFGQIVPISGLPDWAEQMTLGVRAAFDDANRDGGINGRFVNLVTADDGYNPTLAAIEVRKMVEDHKVLAIVGTVGTGTALAMLEYLKPLKVPLIAAVSGARELRRPFTAAAVNIRASYDDEAYLLVDTAVRAGRTRCSVFFQDDGFGRSGLEGARVALWNNGLAIHSNASYDRSLGDTSQALAVLSERTPPEAVIVFAVTGPAVEFICSSSLLPSWESVWYLLPSVVGEDFGDSLGGDCASRVRVFVSRTLPDPTNSSVGVVKAFQQSIDRRCGGEGACAYTSQALEGYLGARLLLQAVARAGSEIDAYSADPSDSFEPARRAARESLLQSIYDAGMFSFEKLRVGPYGGECGNAAEVGAVNLGCECNQGMHNVFLTELVAGAPQYLPSGVLVTPYGFVRRPEGDVFFESCGVSVEYRPQSEQPIVFGQSASFSGDTAGLGTGMQRGIRAAFSFTNGRGGINGKEVRLVSFDDAYNPARAISNTQEALSAHRVFGYIGSTGTPTASAVFPLVTEAKVPWIGALTGAGFLRSPFVPTIVNARASYTDECAAMTKHLVAMGISKVAFFGQDDSFGGAGLSGITLSLKFHRLSLMVDSRYPKGTEAVHSGIVAMLSLPEPPEAIVMFGTSKPLGRFSAILRVTFDRLGYKQPVLYATSFVGARAWRRATVSAMALEASTPIPDYLENMFVASVVPVPDDASHPLVAAYQQDMREAGLVSGPVGSVGQPSKFEYESLEGWIVGRLTTMALQRSASATRADFLKAFYTTSYFQIAAGSQALGPFIDGDCNQGSRRIWIVRANADLSVATGSVGDYLLDESFDFSDLGCGVLAEYSKPNCPDGSERVSLSNTTEAFTCHKCARGFFSSGGAPCRECPAGSVAADEGSPACIKCGPGRFQDRPGQTACLGCDIFSFSTGAANARCTSCGPNAMTFSEGATSRAACMCSPGYFGSPHVEPDAAVLEAVRLGADPPPLPGSDGSMEAVELVPGTSYVPIAHQDGLCRPCPVGARCCRSEAEGVPETAASALNSTAVSTAQRCRTGTIMPLPTSGHIESTRLPATMVACNPAQSCVGVERESQLNESRRCAVGYEGLHCGHCVDGFYNFYGVCNPCGSDDEAWGRAAGMALFILVIVLSALELSTRKSTYTGLGLMLNSLQIGGLFNAVFARWPRMADSFYAAAAVVTFRLDSFSPECKLQHLYPRDIFERQILWLALPFGFAAVYLAIYGIVLCLRALIVRCRCTIRGRYLGYCGMLRMLTLPFPKLNATFVSGFSRLAISGYPVLVSHSLRTMQCVTLEDGVVVMDHSSGALCYDDNWFGWLWTSIIGLVLYGIGIPAGLYLLMVASREAAAMRVADVKHQNRAKRIVELVREAKTPVAGDAATPVGLRAAASHLSCSVAAQQHSDAKTGVGAREGARDFTDSPERHGSQGVVGARTAQGRAHGAGSQAGSSLNSLVDEHVEDPPTRFGAVLNRITHAFARTPSGAAGSLPSREVPAAAPAPADVRSTPPTFGARMDSPPSIVTPALPSSREATDASSPSPGSDGEHQVHLVKWRTSKEPSGAQKLGLRLSRIPTHAVMTQTKDTPAVDDDLSARVRSRALEGSIVVTHEELEQWREEDIRHARNNTSDVLVDADHMLWPFVVDYREETYYWSLVEMAEFALIVLASTFVTDPVSQMSLMMLAILGFMLTVLVCKPYRSTFFNKVELVNDILQVLSLVVGISFVREPRPLSEEASDVALLVMITANLLNLSASIVRDVSDKVDDWKHRSFWGSWRVEATARAARKAEEIAAKPSRRRVQAEKGQKPSHRAKRTSIVVLDDDTVQTTGVLLPLSAGAPAGAASTLASPTAPLFGAIQGAASGPAGRAESGMVTASDMEPTHSGASVVIRSETDMPQNQPEQGLEHKRASEEGGTAPSAAAPSRPVAAQLGQGPPDEGGERQSMDDSATDGATATKGDDAPPPEDVPAEAGSSACDNCEEALSPPSAA
ncbi:hypothetical protein FNF31_04963 [Cafeteria roenbergensis]|uniref:Leucine-binding protein domain-containing protein n=1 Tax=Cafeteria roenbergensis TaxID=33653 RepID=A0A5A8D366_CAFRO|nr:hypothetical protein FNF31_04963 [Cafeteria roenbergensis]